MVGWYTGTGVVKERGLLEWYEGVYCLIALCV